MYIEQILKNNWYTTATPQEMRVALMHLEMNAMDRLNSHLVSTYQDKRQECFEKCADGNGWNKERKS